MKLLHIIAFLDISSTSFQWLNLQRAITHFFPKISPASLLIILCQLTKFEAAGFNSYQDIFNTSVQWRNLQRTISWKKLPGNLLIIFYHLTKFEVSSCNGLSKYLKYKIPYL